MAHASDEVCVDTTLTLAIGGDGTKQRENSCQLQPVPSLVEKDVEDCEQQTKREYMHLPTVINTQGEGKRTRKNVRLTSEQLWVLEKKFAQNDIINLAGKQELAKKLYMTPYQIEIWFQNRRARNKVKQTETSYESLKVEFKNLLEENERLKRELQAGKLSMAKHPVPVPVSKSMCTSCQQTVNDGGDLGVTVAFAEPRVSNSISTCSTIIC